MLDRGPAGSADRAREIGRSPDRRLLPSVRSDRDWLTRHRSSRCRPDRRIRRRRMAIALDEFQGSCRLQWRQRRARAARRGPAATAGRLCLLRSEPTLMERMLGKSRPFYKVPAGDAAEEDPCGSVCRVHRLPVQGHRFPAGGRIGAAMVDLPAICRTDGTASGARGLGRCEGWRGTDCGPRGPAWHIEAAARRARNALRGHVAAPDVGHQRAALRAAVPKMAAAPLGRRPRAPSVERESTVQASLAALVREDILTREGTRYAVVDSLFREWSRGGRSSCSHGDQQS